jgi:hypothetical protein
LFHVGEGLGPLFGPADVSVGFFRQVGRVGVTAGGLWNGRFDLRSLVPLVELKNILYKIKSVTCLFVFSLLEIHIEIFYQLFVT